MLKLYKNKIAKLKKLQKNQILLPKPVTINGLAHLLLR